MTSESVSLLKKTFIIYFQKSQKLINSTWNLTRYYLDDDLFSLFKKKLNHNQI